MPAFRGRITQDQAYQLAVFVRALSGQPRMDVVPSRADEPANTEPLTLTDRRPIANVTARADDRSEEGAQPLEENRQ
jgi:hypothetical protein